MSKYIWLIGENLGATHNNNSYCYWEHIKNKNDNRKIKIKKLIKEYSMDNTKYFN